MHSYKIISDNFQYSFVSYYVLCLKLFIYFENSSRLNIVDETPTACHIHYYGIFMCTHCAFYILKVFACREFWTVTLKEKLFRLDTIIYSRFFLPSNRVPPFYFPNWINMETISPYLHKYKLYLNVIINIFIYIFFSLFFGGIWTISYIYF